MAAMKIILVQSGGSATIFQAFLMPSGLSSSAELRHITPHYFPLNLLNLPTGGTKKGASRLPELFGFFFLVFFCCLKNASFSTSQYSFCC